jgi:hypothetical protein
MHVEIDRKTPTTVGAQLLCNRQRLGHLEGHLRLRRRNSSSPARKATRPRQMMKTVNCSIRVFRHRREQGGLS